MRYLSEIFSSKRKHGKLARQTGSGANRHDMKKLDDLLEATLLYLPLEVRQNLCLDRGYDYAECRILAEDFGYTPHIR